MIFYILYRIIIYPPGLSQYLQLRVNTALCAVSQCLSTSRLFAVIAETKSKYTMLSFEHCPSSPSTKYIIHYTMIRAFAGLSWSLCLSQNKCQHFNLEQNLLQVHLRRSIQEVPIQSGLSAFLLNTKFCLKWSESLFNR